MYKKILPILLMALLSLLAACGSGTASSSDAATTSEAYDVSPVISLLVGTLKLDGTDQDVSAAQAEELLPLWQMLKALSSSDTAAQEELDAVVAQIRDTMTAGQMAAIEAMNLTPDAMFSAMQDLGLSMGGGTADSSSDGQLDLPAGGFQGGGSAPDGSGGPGGGAGAPPSSGQMPLGGDMGAAMDPNAAGGASVTPQPGGAGGASMRLPTQLLDALIEYLQGRIGS